jgi:hypothetical protein
MGTNKNYRMVQDLADILRINRERTNIFTKAAYYCENLPLKTLLNREVDNSSDSAIGIRRLLINHCEIESEPKMAGPVFLMWLDFKPSFPEPVLRIQLQSFVVADLVTLRCYQLMMASDYMDGVSKNLLEFQYQFHLNIYGKLKDFQLSQLNMEKRNVSSGVNPENSRPVLSAS